MAQHVKDLAVVTARSGQVRVATVAQVQSLALEFPHAIGEAPPTPNEELTLGDQEETLSLLFF